MLPLLLAASLGAQIAQRADRFVGHRPPAGRDDCSGFVTAIYGQEGIDLRAPERPGENGVTNIRRRARAARALRHYPRPGDLVFFRNTYRKGLSHVGIVDSVQDGTVTFIHRASKGITRSRLDLRRPHDRSRNDVLRRGPHPGLAGELLSGFASPEPLRG
jgi:cell wall-associated NlpC family hydrolase